MKHQLLEGGMVVEMTDGARRLITVVMDGDVYHRGTRLAFGDGKITPEAEFRANMLRIVSRSQYDTR